MADTAMATLAPRLLTLRLGQSRSVYERNEVTIDQCIQCIQCIQCRGISPVAASSCSVMLIYVSAGLVR